MKKFILAVLVLGFASCAPTYFTTATSTEKRSDSSTVVTYGKNNTKYLVLDTVGGHRINVTKICRWNKLKKAQK